MIFVDIYRVISTRLHDDVKFIVVELEPWDEPVENPEYTQLEELKRQITSNKDAPPGFADGMAVFLRAISVPQSLNRSHHPNMNVITVLPKAIMEKEDITIGTKVQLHISKFEE